jgi:hypothetical protein
MHLSKISRKLSKEVLWNTIRIREAIQKGSRKSTLLMRLSLMIRSVQRMIPHACAAGQGTA